MAFTGNFLCTSFKKELMEAKHNFLASGGNTFNIALYTNSASFTAATTAYTTSNEISGTNYSAKGQALGNVNPTTSSTTAFTDFTDEVFSNVTISSVRGAMIFNDSASGDPSVCILDFGADKAASSGDFTIVFPTADASNAIIRIA
mgnify:FL=1|jgi:hypothetical protein